MNIHIHSSSWISRVVAAFNSIAHHMRISRPLHEFIYRAVSSLLTGYDLFFVEMAVTSVSGDQRVMVFLVSFNFSNFSIILWLLCTRWLLAFRRACNSLLKCDTIKWEISWEAANRDSGRSLVVSVGWQQVIVWLITCKHICGHEPHSR